MMDIDHVTLVALSKSFGLFYLIAMSVAALGYAFWPANQARFNQAAKGVIDDEDKPCR